MLDTDSYSGGGKHQLPTDTHKYTVIILHGITSTADNVCHYAEHWKKFPWYPQTKFIFPTADKQPVAYYNNEMQHAWTNVWEFNFDSEQDLEGFEKSSQRIQYIIKNEIANGIQKENIVLGGFSQGGLMTYFMMLKTEKPNWGGSAILGACLPLQNYNVYDLNNPIEHQFIQINATDDEIVKIEWAKQSYEYVTKNFPNIKGEFMTFDNVGHVASDSIIDATGEFINKIFQ